MLQQNTIRSALQRENNQRPSIAEKGTGHGGEPDGSWNIDDGFQNAHPASNAFGFEDDLSESKRTLKNPPSMRASLRAPKRPSIPPGDPDTNLAPSSSHHQNYKFPVNIMVENSVKHPKPNGHELQLKTPQKDDIFRFAPGTFDFSGIAALQMTKHATDDNRHKNAQDSLESESDQSHPPLIWLPATSCGLKMFVLDHRSDAVVKWMLIVFMLTIYTAIMTPVEVAFFETKLNAWFYLNRVIDFMFLFDMAVNFCLTYEVGNNGAIVTSQHKIMRNYLSFWFWLDLISLVPYDFVAYMLTDSTDPESAGALADIKLLRIIRLFRLMKLVRILRAGRMFQSYQMDYSINYNQLALLKFLVSIVFIIHLMTCGLVFLPQIQDSDGWLDANEVTDMSMGDQYIVAMYWASMTVSTIGYGDISLVTQAERVYASICMMVGATAYAFIVGQLCGLIVNLDKEGSQFTNELSDLNQYMTAQGLTQAQQRQVRRFYGYSKEARGLRSKEKLLSNLSPALYSMVLVHAHRHWLQRVSFLQSDNLAFVGKLVDRLHQKCFAPSEIITKAGELVTKLLLVEKGIVFYGHRILAPGHYIGDQIVLSQPAKHPSTAITHKYSDILYLHRADLHRLLEYFPEMRYKAKKHAVGLLLRQQGVSKKIKQLHSLLQAEQDKSNCAVEVPTKDQLFSAAEERFKEYGNQKLKTVEDLKGLMIASHNALMLRIEDVCSRIAVLEDTNLNSQSPTDDNFMGDSIKYRS